MRWVMSFTIVFVNCIFIRNGCGYLHPLCQGIIISWVTNCTLAEISLNKFFSVVRPKKTLSCIIICCLLHVSWRILFYKILGLCFLWQYFGILFAAIGAVIVWRIRSSRYALAKKSVLNMFAMTVRASVSPPCAPAYCSSDWCLLLAGDCIRGSMCLAGH